MQQFEPGGPTVEGPSSFAYKKILVPVWSFPLSCVVVLNVCVCVCALPGERYVSCSPCSFCSKKSLPRSGLVKLPRFRALQRARRGLGKLAPRMLIALYMYRKIYMYNLHTSLQTLFSRLQRLEDVKDALAKLRGRAAADLEAQAPVLEFGGLAEDFGGC